MRLKNVIILLCLLSGFTAGAQSQGKNIGGTVMMSSKNIFANLSAGKNFTVLVNAIQTAGMVNTFTGTTPVTLLAPDDKAFALLPLGIIDTLLKPQNRAQLTAFINNHILPGKITSAYIARQIKAGNGKATLVTLAGNKLTANIDFNRNIVLTDSRGKHSIISRFDVVNNNGLLHTITQPLVNPLVISSLQQ